MRFVCALTALAMLAGCAAPNTPGAGSGDKYTPIVDMQGLNMTRYYADLEGCRGYARTINPAAEAIAGALVGALVGAAIGSAVGSGYRHQGSMARYGAGYGATTGTLAAGGRAVVKQETVIANCLAGRGYRTLDASVPVNAAAPSPYLPVQAVAAAPSATAAFTVPVAYNPAAYTPPPVQPADLPVARPTGKDTYQAEQLARSQSCSAQPVATLSVKGGGFETYSVPCANGDAIAIRCEFGNCRILQ